MKEKLMNDVLSKMLYLPVKDQEYLKNVLSIVMNDYEIQPVKNEIVEWSLDGNYELLKMFLVAKQVEGCSERTVAYYKSTITAFLDKINVPLQQVETNHIRFYLASREINDKVSKTTQNNERRNLSSFFGWLTAEEYIDKNPMLRVKAIRADKKKKKAFSEVEIERLRNACIDKRERCILEVLLSTGCRVGGLVGMNRSGICNDSIVVKEKGRKERIVYFNAKAKIAIEEYLATRDDDNDALFVTLDQPHERLSISGVEIAMRQLGRRAGVTPSNPHRFRRTCATLARRRGMPLEDIQKMLGHSNIDTTMIYISNDEESLYENHKKFVI